MSENGEACLFPDCGGPRVTRGLCGTHYAYALALVKKGDTNWETLEENKKALPSNRKTYAKRNNDKFWFLDGGKMNSDDG